MPPVGIDRAWVFPTAVLAASTLAAPSPTFPGTGVPDFQQWTELDTVVPLGDDITLTAIAQARFSESLTNPVFSASGIDFSYRHDQWTISAGYRHQITGHRTDEPQVTQIALAMASYARQIGRSTLSFRPLSYVYANDEVFYRFQGNS